jgi:hypothetical protein
MESVRKVKGRLLPESQRSSSHGCMPRKLQKRQSARTSALAAFSHLTDFARTTSAGRRRHRNVPNGERACSHPIPAVYQWSFSIQQKLSSSWALEGDCVGSHRIHQFQFIDSNAATLPLGDVANAPMQERGHIRMGQAPGRRSDGPAITPLRSVSRAPSGMDSFCRATSLC